MRFWGKDGWAQTRAPSAKVAVKIAKHSDHAVLGLFRFTHECYTLSHHLAIVAPKVVGAEKKNSATRLIADKRRLFGS